MLAVLIDCGVKATVLLLLALAAVAWGRRASAALRHVIWATTVAGILLLPALAGMLPGWRVLPAWERGSGEATATRAEAVYSPPTVETGARDNAAEGDGRHIAAAPDAGAEASRAMADAPAGPRAVAVSSARAWKMPSLEGVVTALYATGVVVCLMPLLVASLLLRRLEKQARRVVSGRLVEALEVLAKGAGVRRPIRLVMGRPGLMPMTWGIFRPLVCVPEEAAAWTAERVRCVLLHELAHVKRRDVLTLLLARVACAVYWAHPLAWLAAGRMRAAAEEACDDVVLEQGTKASAYAEELITITDTLLPLRVPALTTLHAIAMARGERRSVLHGRIRAVLDGGRNRRRVSARGVMVVMVSAACLLVPLACVKSAGMAGAAGYKEVEVTWRADAAGTFSLESTRRATLKNPIEIEHLARFFPEMDQGKKAWIAGGWIAYADFAFTLADGAKVHISVNPELTSWSEGRGDWPVKGDLAAALRALPWDAAVATFADFEKLLNEPIDAPAVKDFAARYGLKKYYKFDSGGFADYEHQPLSLLYREDRIVRVIVMISHPQDIAEVAKWAVYRGALPGGVLPTDSPEDVIQRLGQPTQQPQRDVLFYADRRLTFSFDRRTHNLEEIDLDAPPLVAGTIEAKQTDFVPEMNKNYALAPGSLYKAAEPGPAEAGSSAAWALANEFVYRTALRKTFRLPAASVTPGDRNYDIIFNAIAGDEKLRILVDKQSKLLEQISSQPPDPANIPNLPAKSAPADDTQAIVDAMKVPAGWKAAFGMGSVHPPGLAGGNGLQITFEPDVPPAGKFVPLTVWLMDWDYSGARAAATAGPQTPVTRARELERWNDRRVYITGTAWAGAEAAVVAALKQTNVDTPWGEVANGLQLRLRPGRSVWNWRLGMDKASLPGTEFFLLEKSPTLRLDARVVGVPGPIGIIALEAGFKLEWDGVIYSYAGYVEAKSYQLMPGPGIGNIEFSLAAPWKNAAGKAPGVEAGKHVARAVSLDGKTFSNAAEVEILADPAGTKLPLPGKAGALISAPERATGGAATRVAEESVSGIVVDEQGRPAAGVVVTRQFVDRRFQVDSVASATTGIDGRFRMSLAAAAKPNGDYMAFTADRSRAGYLSFVQETVPPAELRITLRSARVLPVNVVDGGGRAVADATVVAGVSSPLASVTTDRAGKATLTLPVDAPLGFVAAYKAAAGLDYALFWQKGKPQTDLFRLAPDAAGPVTLKLEGAKPVTVTAVDGSNRPLEGVTVRPWLFKLPDRGEELNVRMPAFLRRTDASGRVTFDFFPADNVGAITLLATKDGMISADQWDFNPAVSGDQMTVTLGPLVHVTGKVMARDGSPASGTTVYVNGSSHAWDAFNRNTVTAADGSFSFDVNPDHFYIFMAQKDHDVSPLASTTVRAASPAPVVLKLQPGIRVFGTLTAGQQRTPVPNGQINFILHSDLAAQSPEAQQLPNPRGAAGQELGNFIHRVATSKPDGSYEFYALPGPYRLSANIEGVLNSFDLGNVPEFRADLHANGLPAVPAGRPAAADTGGLP